VIEYVYGGFFGLNLAIMGYLTYRFSICQAKIDALHEFSLTLNQNQPTLDGLAEKIEDIVADTLENLEMPTAQDHFAGGLMQMAQMLFMRKLGLDKIQAMLPTHGPGAEVEADLEPFES
jgi:lipoate-protein ligase B